MIDLTYKDFAFAEIVNYIPSWSWPELKFGVENRIISKNNIIDYAKDCLEENMENFEVVLEIVILDDKEDILRLINKLIVLENKNIETAIIIDKWRFAILLYLYMNRDKYSNVYEIIAEIAADFNHPEDMDGFIYYKPMGGVGRGSIHWENYLREQCIRYNVDFPSKHN